MNRKIMGIRRRYWCHIAAAAFSFIVAAPVVAMLADNTPPIIVVNTEMHPPQVVAGQTVRVTWTAREFRACDGVVNRRFIDSAGVIFDTAPIPTVYRRQLSGGGRSFSREIQIPSGMSPGPAIYTGTRRYWCNPLQQLLRGLFGAEINLPVEPVRFTVIKG